jgi:hypothetical protein
MRSPTNAITSTYKLRGIRPRVGRREQLLGPVASRFSLVGFDDGVCAMSEAVETKWPVLTRHDRALEWLRIWIDLGRAPRTIDAYGRGLAEYLQVCEREGIDPLAATRAQVAVFVRELTSRPSRRGTNVVALDSGSGLANATLQQRLSVTWNLAALEIISLR